VAGIIWKEIEQSVGVLTPVKNETILIRLIHGKAERAIFICWLLPGLQIDHTVWRP
jgi:hypothetical protein